MAFAEESAPMPPQRRRPVMGLGRFPNAACRRKQKGVHVDNFGKSVKVPKKENELYLLNNMRPRQAHVTN